MEEDWMIGIHADAFIVEQGIGKEERNAKYFKKINKEEELEHGEIEKEKLRVLGRFWYLNGGSESDNAKRDWEFYEGKVCDDGGYRERSNRKDRNKNGRVTLNIIDYGIRDANARIAIRMKKYSEAIGFLNDMLTRKKDEPNVWLMLGKCYLELNDAEKSAVSCVPDLPECGLRLAEACFHFGEIDFGILCCLFTKKVIEDNMTFNSPFSIRRQEAQLQELEKMLSKFLDSDLTSKYNINLLQTTGTIETLKTHQLFVEQTILPYLTSGSLRATNLEDEFDPMNL